MGAEVVSVVAGQVLPAYKVIVHSSGLTPHKSFFCFGS